MRKPRRVPTILDGPAEPLSERERRELARVWARKTIPALVRLAADDPDLAEELWTKYSISEVRTRILRRRV